MNESLPDIYPNSVGDEAYEDFQPLVQKYGDPNDSLNVYLHGLGNMFKQVDDIARDGPDGEPGWSQIFDLGRAKTEWLPWMGQLTGYQVPIQTADETLAEYDARQRERIITRSSHRRGTIDLLVEVVQEQLTGAKRVLITERYGGNKDLIKVWVYQSEIGTSTAEVQRAALSQKVAGLLMDFQILSGSDYNTLRANSVSYQDVKTTYATYQAVFNDPSL